MDIHLRAVAPDDLPLIMAWRGNPICYDGYYSQTEPLRWEEHLTWYLSRPSSWRSFIILYEGRPVGLVNIGQMEHWSPELGYTLGEISLWGKGITAEAVRQAMEYLKEQGKEYCHTTILDNNERSIRMIKKLGFEYLGKARPGESWYQRRLQV